MFVRSPSRKEALCYLVRTMILGSNLQGLWVLVMVVLGGGGSNFVEVLGDHFVLDVVGCNL